MNDFICITLLNIPFSPRSITTGTFLANWPLFLSDSLATDGALHAGIVSLLAEKDAPVEISPTPAAPPSRSEASRGDYDSDKATQTHRQRQDESKITGGAGVGRAPLPRQFRSHVMAAAAWGHTPGNGAIFIFVSQLFLFAQFLHFFCLYFCF